MPEGSRLTPDQERLARRIDEAFNRGDFDAVLALYAPDAVWDASSVGWSFFEGHEEMRGLFEDWLGAYQDFRQQTVEAHNFGHGVTLSVLDQRGRPLSSSAVLAERFAIVWTWREGLVERATVYNDIDQARADAERFAKERG